MAKISKDRLVFGLFLITFIAVIELVLHHFHLATWPAFMVMIFFFETHMNTQRAPHIIIGGLFGILCIVLIQMFMKAFAPMMGLLPSQILFICIVVYAIVAFGEVVPWVFNNYAFMYFLVSAVALKMQGAHPNPWLWMAIEAVSGIIIILGIIGIARLTAMIMTPKQAESPSAT